MAVLDDKDFKNLQLKRLDKKRKYLKVFANDEIQNLFLWADQNSNSIGFNFDPNASIQEYLVVTNKSGISFRELRKKIKKLGLKTIMIRRTPRTIHNIDEQNVKKDICSEMEKIVRSVVAESFKHVL